MVQKVTRILTGLVVFYFCWIPSFARTLTINDLVNQSVNFDKQVVTLEAEVIGERLERGEYSWININDQTNAIGIWVPTDWTSDIKIYGDYFHTGDSIHVQGIFNRSCTEHGGEMDIHALTISVVKSGYSRSKSISPWKFTLAVILLTIALAMSMRYKSYLDMMRSKRKHTHLE